MKNIQSTSGFIMGGALACSMHPGDLPQIRQSPEWKLLRRQIVDKAIYFTDQLVFDFRRLLTQGRTAEVAGRLMWQLIKAHRPQVLIGPGFGASPLLYSTALAALADGVELQVLMVRDKRKAHNQYHVEQIKAGDGKLLQDAQVDKLVQAMANFAPPAMGQTSLTAEQKTALAPLLANSWH